MPQPPAVLTDARGTRFELIDRTEVAQFLEHRGHFEGAELDLLRRYLRPGDVALDVGANIGHFTATIGRAVGAEGFVHAFEPLASNRERLRRTLELNGLQSRVEVVAAAVTAQAGEVSIVDYGEGFGSWATTKPAEHDLRGDVPHDATTIAVPGVTLDDYCREHAIEHVAVLKIDVEGAEFDVIDGATALLAAGADMLVVECSDSTLTAALRPEIDAAVARVLDSGWYLLGGEGEAFEREFASMLGVAHAAGVANGTDAIELALRALDVGRGDEVVTQANTCVPTVAAIERTGATPVLCDVLEATATIDPESLAAACGPRTKAIVPVHLYGQVGDLDAVIEIAARHAAAVVEDCAQAHLATCRDRCAGATGLLGAFSFYPTKNLGALGDGGAVVTADAELDARLRRLRTYGQSDRYHHVERGINSRLDELQAAILRVKLPHLRAWHARRNEIAAIYDAALQDTPLQPLGRLDDREHAFHLYVVRAPRRDDFAEALARAGVRTLIHYPRPIHLHEPYRELAAGSPSLARCELLATEIVSLPLYPELTAEQVAHVAAAARDAALSAGQDS
ncbi:MAG: FkbM family methyltransferase [Actinobacteria bacterium]|nr:FkbM family methyltransferase [Actinomycetota bacterium]